MFGFVCLSVQQLKTGKGGASSAAGAELGFVYQVPGERLFLVLFNRIKLSVA